MSARALVSRLRLEGSPLAEILALRERMEMQGERERAKRRAAGITRPAWADAPKLARVAS